MGRLTGILFLACAIVALGGCDGQQTPAEKPLKVGDLAPVGAAGAGDGDAGLGQRLKLINFDIITYEIPPGKLASLDGILSPLNTQAIRFADSNAIAGNSIRLAAGPVRMLEEAFSQLRAAGASKRETTSLLIPDGGSERLITAKVAARTVISYVGRGGGGERVEAGPGYVGLEVGAGRFPTLPSASVVRILPVFFPSIEGLAPELAERMKAREVRFEALQASMNMRRGDFVLVAPSRYCGEAEELCGLLFGAGTVRTGPLSSGRAARVYLIICTALM